MDRQTQKALEEIIKNYDQFTTNVAENIISELKKRCRTLGDLEAQFARLKTWIPWSIGATKAAPLIVILEKQIQAEKNDLLLTNRS